jgi:hypothetical protein
MLMMAICVPVANADTYIYAYTGNDYTYAVAPYTTSDSITGSFTIAELAPDLVAQLITPVSYTFSDGVQTLDNTNACDFCSIFYVSTDASGQITAWLIQVVPTTPTDSIYTDSGIPTSNLIPRDEVEFNVCTSSGCYAAEVLSDPGSWSGQDSSVPEPSPLALMSPALLVLVFVARKRGAPGIRPSPQMPR